MVGTGHLRSTSRLVMPAVSETITNLALAEVDEGATRLALLYAEEIDAAEDADRAVVLKSLGPLLLQVLESLGATPKARAALLKPSTAGTGKLSAFRSARAS